MRPSIWETLGNRIVSIFIRIGHRTTYHRVEFYGSSENSKNCKGKTCKANKNRDILSASYEHPRTIVIISFRSVVSKKSLRPSYDGHTTIESPISSKEDPRRWFDRYSWLPRRYRQIIGRWRIITKSSPLDASKRKMGRGGEGGGGGGDI